MLKNQRLNVNKTDCYGVNALWISCYYGHVEVRAISIAKDYFKIVKLLHSKRIDLMSRNHNGSNSLHIAVKK